MSQETGQLIEKGGEISVEWRIDCVKWRIGTGFPLEFCEETGDIFHTSPIFSLSDSCWRMRICEKSHLNSERLLVHLVREDAGPPKTVSFKITGPFDSIKGRQSFFTDCATYTRLVNLFSSSSIKILSIYCTLKSDDEFPLEESLFGRLWNASLSIRKILGGKERTDVVLKLKSREVRAHRLILETRFPDFTRKVDNAIETGEVNVEDADEEAFEIVLSYAYSGEPEGLSSKNVCAVYRIARSYGLQGLIKLCKLFLEKNLCVDNVCDVIEMATKYEEVELKESAKVFFAKNSQKVLKTDKWKSFKEENSTLILELLECMMKGESEQQS